MPEPIYPSTPHAGGPEAQRDTAYFVDRAVLVVEDEPFTAVDVALTFEGLGARTLHATNCAQAERAIKAVGGPERLIGAILDVKLRGNETVRPIAEQLVLANVPIVLHTMLPERAARDIVGVDAVQVSKPAPPAKLVQALRLAASTRLHSIH